MRKPEAASLATPGAAKSRCGHSRPDEFILHLLSFIIDEGGRGGEIRTHDLLVPNQALYQAKLRPETRGATVQVIPSNAKGKYICFTHALRQLHSCLMACLCTLRTRSMSPRDITSVGDAPSSSSSTGTQRFISSTVVTLSTTQISRMPPSQGKPEEGLPSLPASAIGWCVRLRRRTLFLRSAGCCDSG